MGIYIKNGPIVLTSENGDYEFFLSVDGNAWKDGKRVVSWDNVRTDSYWLSIEYDGEGSNANAWYYGFILSFYKNFSKDERSARCSVDYTLSDGTTASDTFIVYQQGEVGIEPNCTNPLFFDADDYQVSASPDVLYRGVTEDTTATPYFDGSQWSVYATSGGRNGNNMHIEYDIAPQHYNVTSEDITGSVRFSYLSSENVTEYYYLYLNQKSCQYPFGLKYANGVAIPLEGTGINQKKRIRNISFKGQTILLNCYYPYLQENSITVKFDDGDGIATCRTGGGYLDDEIAEEQYTITFKESFEPYTRGVSLSVEYVSKDGEKHTDYVQLIQDASDGSNLEKSVTCYVSEIKVQSDGTPETNSGKNIKVRYTGDINWTVPTCPEWISLGNPILIEGEGTKNRLYEWSVTYDINTTDEIRSATIDFAAEDNEYNTYGDAINVIQAKAERKPIINPDIPVEGDEYIGPIWKDIEYSFGNNNTVEYEIYQVKEDKEMLVFSGRSYKKPNANNNSILVNKICQNYLDIPELVSDHTTKNSGYGVFKLKSFGGQTLYKTYKFIGDWSYSTDFKTGVLSHPILNDNSVYYGQYLPFTVFAAAEEISVKYGIKYKNGYKDEYDKPVEDWIMTEYIENNVKTINFPISSRNYKDGVSGYVINGIEYELADNCKVDYVVYYLNPWGGYDWFPIKGKVVESDTLTTHTYSQNYNNTTWQFGKRRYLSEIKKKYQLNTHWLREDESKRMWYLMQSNTVYLHNIKTNKVFPVVITNSTQEHKKRGLITNRISYQIEVELSQGRERI